MDIVGKTVQQDNWLSVPRPGIVIGDIQDAGVYVI
jgi:hypothetical protein